MKQGCLILIAVITAVFWGYKELLQGTELVAMWWIPLLFGLIAAMLVGNSQGIFLALRHLRASKRSQSQWRDGDLVVLSGRLQTPKSSIVAPISGKPAAIIEYELSRQVDMGESTTTAVDYRGCIMVPSSIQSVNGQASVVGFPLLAHWQSERYGDPESYQRIAKFLLATPATITPKSPIAAIAELNKVLKDDDGEVNANYRDAAAPDIQELAKLPILQARSEIVVAEDSELDDEDRQFRAELEQYKDSQDPTERIIHFLRNQGYSLRETIVPNNAEVTIMGTYQAAKRHINIGSGLSNLAHGIYSGPLSKVLGKNLNKSIKLTTFFLVIFLVANYFLLLKIGLKPEDLLLKLQTFVASKL